MDHQPSAQRGLRTRALRKSGIASCSLSASSASMARSESDWNWAEDCALSPAGLAPVGPACDPAIAEGALNRTTAAIKANVCLAPGKRMPVLENAAIRIDEELFR